MARRRTRAKRSNAEQLLDGLDGEAISSRLEREARKTERIELRVSSAEKEMIQMLADRCAVSTSSLLVTLAGLAAERLSIR